jgi:DNA-binding transcriptional ArsR family regulator
MEVASMSANEWVDAVTSALSNQAEKVPDGWKTARQLGAIFNVRQRAVSVKIIQLKEAGLVEQRKFRIQTNRGLYPEIHYKLIKKK